MDNFETSKLSGQKTMSTANTIRWYQWACLLILRVYTILCMRTPLLVPGRWLESNPLLDRTTCLFAGARGNAWVRSKLSLYTWLERGWMIIAKYVLSSLAYAELYILGPGGTLSTRWTADCAFWDGWKWCCSSAWLLTSAFSALFKGHECDN